VATVALKDNARSSNGEVNSNAPNENQDQSRETQAKGMTSQKHVADLRVVNYLRDRKNDRVNIVRPMERRMGTVIDSRRFIVSMQWWDVMDDAYKRKLWHIKDTLWFRKD
jgi:hypothetical protein